MAALVTAAALHLGLALAVFWQGLEGGAEAPGIGGIEIALGPSGGAPGGEERPAQEAVEAVETDIAGLVDVPADEPVPADSPGSVQAETVQPLAEPAARWPSERTVAVEALTATASSFAGAEGRAGAAAGPDAGSDANDASAGGIAGAEADYAAVLLAWLEPHKEYPRRARARRQQGVVRLFIAVGRAGEVREAYVLGSAGHALLERAALDMLERARPLPPLPDDIPGERLELVVPVHFFIGGGRRPDSRLDVLTSSRQRSRLPPPKTLEIFCQILRQVERPVSDPRGDTVLLSPCSVGDV